MLRTLVTYLLWLHKTTDLFGSSPTHLPACYGSCVKIPFSKPVSLYPVLPIHHFLYLDIPLPITKLSGFCTLFQEAFFSESFHRVLFFGSVSTHIRFFTCFIPYYICQFHNRDHIHLSSLAHYLQYLKPSRYSVEESVRS